MIERINPSTTFHKAKEFGISRLAAGRMRLRYLNEQINWLLQCDSDIAFHWVKEMMDEAIYIADKMYSEPLQNAQNSLTDDLIEQARAYPIENLITFSRGKAVAFCHEDKRPSLHLYKKTNKCRCFVCDRSFNPIDILMHRGYTFSEAVKALT